MKIIFHAGSGRAAMDEKEFRPLRAIRGVVAAASQKLILLLLLTHVQRRRQCGLLDTQRRVRLQSATGSEHPNQMPVRTFPLRLLCGPHSTGVAVCFNSVSAASCLQ